MPALTVIREIFPVINDLKTAFLGTVASTRFPWPGRFLQKTAFWSSFLTKIATLQMLPGLGNNVSANGLVTHYDYEA